MKLLVPVLGFLLGVGVASLATGNYLTAGLVAGGFLVAVLVLKISGKVSVPLGLIFLSLVLFGVGIWRTEMALEKVTTPPLDRWVGQEVQLAGWISEGLDERLNSTKLTVTLDGLQVDDWLRPVNGKVLVTIEPELSYVYGQEILVSGKLQQPENFTSDTGREFDYVHFLAKDGIGYQMFRPEISVTGDGRGSGLKSKLLALKNNLIAQADQVMPQPAGALLSGILYGEKSALGGSLQDDFRDTGIIHIVVLSGYNVTIVAFALLQVFSLVSVSLGMMLGGLGIIAFAILTGAGATIVRASLMALLVVVAKVLGRRYDITRALVLAGFLMVLHNPLILVFDISFQLSFLATLGLIYVAPICERWFKWLPEFLMIRTNAVATISTQIFVLPLLLYYMGQLSIVSPLVNILVLPVIPLAMLTGFLTALTGFVSSAMSLVFMVPTYAMLEYVLTLVDWFAQLPFAVANLPPISLWMVVAMYGLLAWWLSKTKPTQDGSAWIERLSR